MKYISLSKRFENSSIGEMTFYSLYCTAFFMLLPLVGGAILWHFTDSGIPFLGLVLLTFILLIILWTRLVMIGKENKSLKLGFETIKYFQILFIIVVVILTAIQRMPIKDFMMMISVFILVLDIILIYMYGVFLSLAWAMSQKVPLKIYLNIVVVLAFIVVTNIIWPLRLD
jgi:hypothetical protein